MSNITEKLPLYSILKLNENDFKEFICGWGAAVINVTVTFPINKIIFRQILEGAAVGTAVEQLSREGISLLYRGILPPLCQKTLSLSLMFSLYEGGRQRFSLLTGNTILANVLAANIAGTAEAFLMPFERVQTLLQDWRYHNQFKNMPHAFKYLLTNYGMAECYRGMLPIVFRNGVSNLMFFTLRDESKKLMGKRESLLTNFVSGAMIGSFTSTVVYPMNVMKIHMQMKIGGKFENILVVIREVYVSRDRNLASLYKGVHLNFMRSFISWGVINASYDFLKGILFF